MQGVWLSLLVVVCVIGLTWQCQGGDTDMMGGMTGGANAVGGNTGGEAGGPPSFPFDKKGKKDKKDKKNKNKKNKKDKKGKNKDGVDTQVISGNMGGMLNMGGLFGLAGGVSGPPADGISCSNPDAVMKDVLESIKKNCVIPKPPCDDKKEEGKSEGEGTVETVKSSDSEDLFDY